MAALGVLSLLQFVFLPGFLILLLMRMNQGVLRSLFLSFGLSLLFNFVLVLFLVLMGWYKSPVVLIVFFLEFCLLMWLIASRALVFKLNAPNFLDHLKLMPASYRYLFLISFILLLGFVYYAFFVSGSILNHPDPGLSWARWSFAWYQGHIPQSTFYYPQLMPASWSLIYKFMGSDLVQLFVKMTTPLYVLGILAVFYDLYFRKSNFVFITAAIVCALFFLFCPYNSIHAWLIANSGAADMPCAFFSMLSLYTILILNHESSKKTVVTYFFLGLCFCVGAMLSKQTGWIIALTYPIIFYAMVLHKNKLFRYPLAYVLLAYVLILMLGSPWYVYRYYQMHFLGIEPYVYKVGAQIYGKTNYWGHIVRSFIQLFQMYYWLAIILFALALIGAFLTKLNRILFVLVILPSFFIWTRYLGYDGRAFFQAVPAFSLLAGSALLLMLDYFRKKTLPFHPKYILPLLFVICVLGASLFVSNKRLVLNQVVKQVRLDNPVNKAIVTYFNDREPQGTILTNYLYLSVMPVFRNYFMGGKIYDVNPRFRRAWLAKTLKSHPNICYIFISTQFLHHDILTQTGVKPENIQAYLKYNVLDNPALKGRYDIIANNKVYLFLKLKHCKGENLAKKLERRLLLGHNGAHIS